MALTMKTGAYSLALALAACGLPLAAQTSGGTCSLPLTGFVIEYPVDLSTLKSTLTQTLPSTIASTQEVRSRTSYNVATRILRNDLFTVSKGSVIPTPASTNIDSSRVGYTVVYVEKVLQSCTPAPSVAVTGYVADGSPLYGDPSGAPYTYSFSYATKPPSQNPFANPGFPQFRDIVTTSGGVSTGYQDRSGGAIAFATPASAGGPSIVLSLPPNVTTVPVSNSPYQVDASYSTDPNGALSFEWASDKPAAFWPGNFSPTPLISFQNGAGDYNITLTVTNVSGVKTSTKFKLTYTPK